MRGFRLERERVCESEREKERDTESGRAIRLQYGGATHTQWNDDHWLAQINLSTSTL